MSASSPTAVMTMTGTPSCRARSRTSSSSPSPSGSRRSSSTASCWPLSASCAPRPACRRDPARCHGGAMRPSARRPCPPRPRPEESARAVSPIPSTGSRAATRGGRETAPRNPPAVPMDAAVPARIICRLGAVEYDRPLTAPHQLLAVHGTSPVDAAIAAGVVVRRGHHHGRRRHHDHRRAAVDNPGPARRPAPGRRRRQAAARPGATAWKQRYGRIPGAWLFPKRGAHPATAASIEGVDCVNIAREPPRAPLRQRPQAARFIPYNRAAPPRSHRALPCTTRRSSVPTPV